MKKTFILLIGFLCLFPLLTVAAQAPKANKIIQTRIVSASKDTTVTFGGIKIFIPAGQSILLTQMADNSVMVRGFNLKRVKIADGTVTSSGAVVLTVQPESQVITINRGNDVQVQDANGRTASLSSGASVSAADIRTSVTPSTTITINNTATQTPATTATMTTAAVPGDESLVFVMDTVITDSAASEQAAQDVIVTEEEDLLSPSAP